MSADWVPFGMTDDETGAYQVLVAGVPTWLKEPLLQWLRPHLVDGQWVRVQQCLDLQMTTRVQLGVKAGSAMYTHDLMAKLRVLDDMQLLRIADYIISTKSYVRGSLAMQLDGIFETAKSKWAVGERSGKAGLVERVPAGVQDSVEGTIASAGSAGQILAREWAQVHGLQPNDSGAYADAVRAVEIAAIGVVQPNHTTATLGTVLGQMRADGDWRLPLREHPEAHVPDLILGMGRTLWFGHRDRHGSVDYSDVDHEEARAAVALAATLVEWFTSGAIARRSG